MIATVSQLIIFFVLFRGSKCVESEGWVCQHDDKNPMIPLKGEIKNECNIIRKSCIEVNLAPLLWKDP